MFEDILAERRHFVHAEMPLCEMGAVAGLGGLVTPVADRFRSERTGWRVFGVEPAYRLICVAEYAWSEAALRCH